MADVKKAMSEGLNWTGLSGLSGLSDSEAGLGLLRGGFFCRCQVKI